LVIILSRRTIPHKSTEKLARKEYKPAMSSSLTAKSALAVFAAIAVCSLLVVVRRRRTKSSSTAAKEARPAAVPAKKPEVALAFPVQRRNSDAVHLPEDQLLGPRLMDGNGINKIFLHDINSLRSTFPSVGVSNNINETYNKVMGEEDYILSDIVRKHRLADSRMSEAFVRAGPRSTTHFDPTKVRAAIVTCGGLCPGLNNVIRELVNTLHHLYNAAEVIGIRGGFAGFAGKKGFKQIKLTPETVADIHHQGGTLLASSRGGFDIEAIIAFLKRERISQLFVIGGDGTHRGAYTIAEEVVKRHMNVSVIGIPKTIDNDVDIIDRSFGFTTSVEAAQVNTGNPLCSSSYLLSLVFSVYSLSTPIPPVYPCLYTTSGCTHCYGDALSYVHHSSSSLFARLLARLHPSFGFVPACLSTFIYSPSSILACLRASSPLSLHPRPCLLVLVCSPCPPGGHHLS
jgi:hypothetical protein